MPSLQLYVSQLHLTATIYVAGCNDLCRRGHPPSSAKPSSPQAIMSSALDLDLNKGLWPVGRGQLLSQWSSSRMRPTSDRLATAAGANRTGQSRVTNATATPNDGQLAVGRDRDEGGVGVDGDIANGNAGGDALSVAEAARLLGRDRTRIYALLRSGDLVAASPAEDGGVSGPLRIDRSSLERWVVAGGGRGGPLTPRNAWR
jgi:hypothetical protein